MQEELKKLLNLSYSPYSSFQVSCIVVMKDGKKFTGVNIENASYGATVCAERVAIFKAISEGYTKNDFEKLYVMTSGEEITPSCFICRQVITEFIEEDKEIIFINKYGKEEKYLVKELCPRPFSSIYLEK